MENYRFFNRLNREMSPTDEISESFNNILRVPSSKSFAFSSSDMIENCRKILAKLDSH